MFKHAKLRNAFKVADLSLSLPGYKKRYPAILSSFETEDKIQYVFKIPPGLDPREVVKKEYVFHQLFGNSAKLDGDGLIYTLQIHKQEIETSYHYNYEELKLKGNLPIVSGKDENGKFYCFDMVINPHLLIAGETGSGKSVMLRTILTTLILTFRGGLDLYLADMKRSEFHLFRRCDIVKKVMTTKEDLAKCLITLKKELTNRGDLLDKHEVEHINEYNKLGLEKKNYIVLCIDEVYLLKKEKELMDIVEEISCIGRALGIFLILSMQRPDSKLMEGQLKNNMTVRYAFRHSDKINSDITLGRGMKENAAKISAEEKGKFYYKNESITLLQAPFLSVEETKILLQPFKVHKELEIQEESDFAPLPILEGGVDEPT